MIPILYKSTETVFANNGIGALSDCISCTVTEERNGIYELEMEYPMDGIHYRDIALRSLIYAKASQKAYLQPFRVYEITKPLDGIVTVYAQHISYDLAGIPVSPFPGAALGAGSALSDLKLYAAVDCPFTFWTDITSTAQMKVSVPTPIRSVLGGTEGSILDVYGGEYEFDGFTVKLHKQRGKDNGVTIRYGKNLTDIRQEENCANVYTGVYPYWTNSEGDYRELPEGLADVGHILLAEGTFDYTRILPLDLSDRSDEPLNAMAMLKESRDYMKQAKIGVPRVSITASFVDLSKTTEYADIAQLETVDLGDTVHVEFEKLGISSTAKVIKTVYNVLLERYDSVDIGDVKGTFLDDMVSIRKERYLNGSNMGLLHPSYGGGEITEGEDTT